MTLRGCSGAAFGVMLVLAGLAAAGPVELSGSVVTSAQKSWVSGDTLVSPVGDVTLTVNPSVSFWGLPLSLDILISTQENNLRQQLNKYRFFLHPAEWVSGLTDISGFALAIKGIELGSCNPSWSPYVLSGASVLGAAVELNPWKVYLAGAAGRVQRAVIVSDSTDGAYSRMLYAGKTGYGKKEATHFYLTGLYATDDPNSLADNQLPMPGDTMVPPDSFEVVTPQENYVLGAEFNLLLGEELFLLESELAVSELSRDTRVPKLEEDWVRRYGLGFLNLRWCTSVDFAYKVRPSLNVLDTKLYGEVAMVGPGFRSFGVPSLRQDNLSYGCGVEREFLDGSISAAASVKQERDNLLATHDSAGNELRLKNTTTQFTNWEASLGFAFPDLPYLQLGYYPYAQRDDSGATAGNVVSVSAGHSFATGSLSHSPSVTFGYTDLSGGDPGTDYTSWDVGISHSLGFEFPLTLSVGGGLAQTSSVDTTNRTWYADFSPSYSFANQWIPSLSTGMSFSDQGTRLDLGADLSVPFLKVFSASAGAMQTFYWGKDEGYNEFRLNGSVSVNW